MKTAIITGITGQDGAYLSQLLIEKGYRVVGLVRQQGAGDLRGLNYLGIASQVCIEKCDLLNPSMICEVLRKFKPVEVYNLAAQSSVELSFRRPVETIEFNLMSVLNLLEGIKNVDDSIRFYQASTSEMYGKIEHLPVTEESSVHPISPYGTSKAVAHLTTVNYREAFGLFACCGILFNHESFLRRENFFVKKVIRESLEIAEKKRKTLRLGNIDICRDFGHAPEYVKAMWLMLQSDKPDDYVVCSGQSLPLKEIVGHVFKRLSIPKGSLVIDSHLYRPTEILDIRGNCEKAKAKLNWRYNLNFYDVLDRLIEEEQNSRRRAAI